MINVLWLVLMIGPLIELHPFCVKKDNSSCKSKICKLNRSYRSLSEDHFNITAELLQFRAFLLVVCITITITMALFFHIYSTHGERLCIKNFMRSVRFYIHIRGGAGLEGGSISSGS